MTQPPRPVPLHVPVLTEVIELLDVPASADANPAGGAQVDDVLSPPAAPLPQGFAPPPPLHAQPTLVSTAPLLVDALDVPEGGSLAPAPLPLAQAALSTPAGTSTTTATALPLASASLSPLAQAAGLPDEAQIAQRVLADVQRQIDGMLEYRLREALAPILARSSEALVRELRQELSKTMRDVVARSVAQEVARHKPKP
jgi:hypothetical protein